MTGDNQDAGFGQEQSPIDLCRSQCILTKPDDVHYFERFYVQAKAEILTHGTNFQVSLADCNQENHTRLHGSSYRCLQFHFHSPSEHTIDGAAFDMELHLVHQASDGSLAVFGILFRAGKPNAFLDQFWDHLHDINLQDKQATSLGLIDLSPLVVEGDYYQYRGSLTTPPYTEGVEWIVSTNVMEASMEQIEQFTTCLKQANARPLQPLGSRKVKLYLS